MADHPTLVRPPPVDPSKSAIENVLDLTDLSPIGPVCITATFLPNPSNLFAGYVHEHQAPLAPSRSARHLWRCGDRPLPRCSPANRSLKLYSPQHALLFRSRRRQRDPSHVLCRTHSGRAIVCHPNGAGQTKGQVYIHDHHVVCP